MKLPISFTHLRSAEQCLRQYHRLYVKKDIPFVETDASRWGVRVHEAMEKRLMLGMPLGDGMQAYEQFVPTKTGRMRGLIEYKMGIRQDGTGCDFFADDCWLRGKVDFALVDHETKSAALVDWKTGKPRENADELEIFALLLRAKYPHITKFTGWYVWLKDCRMGQIHDLSDVNGKLAELKHRVNRIDQATTLDNWPPQQGPLCPYCSVRDCEFNRPR